MRKRGSVTGRHLAIAALVMVVVNAQLTWWIIFATGQARDRLDLERALLENSARTWAAEVVARGFENEPTLPDDLEVIAVSDDDGSRPAIALPAHREGWVVRPTEEAWSNLLEEYRRRIVMMVSEGGFFAVLLLVLMGLLWRTFRREVILERQHRNFLAAITHELRSPIAAIRVALETVVKGRADSEAADRFVGNALADTDRLDRLVQKVLQATRYDSGTLGLSPRRTDLSSVVEKAVLDFQPGAAAAGAKVEAEIEKDLEAEIDTEAMTIAVSNLLENALKYGGDPAVVRVVLRADDHTAVIEVSDNGRGIPEKEIPLIFDRFYRSGDEMTRTSQGTGLGLFLVQRIVKAHHGAVTVAATGEFGTTFRVTLPGVDVGEDRE
jgi:signal transduction histidine kinase